MAMTGDRASIRSARLPDQRPFAECRSVCLPASAMVEQLDGRSLGCGSKRGSGSAPVRGSSAPRISARVLRTWHTCRRQHRYIRGWVDTRTAVPMP